MQKLTLLSVLAILCLKTIAQSPPVIPLKIGDTVPDFIVNNVYNYPDSIIRLSDLKGRLLILDFWGTWCGACIETFPEMHDLKKEFGDDLQVLFINLGVNETPAKVNTFFKNRKSRTGQSFEFPYVLYDTILAHYFSVSVIPHYVWLDSTLRVIAITGKAPVAAANIQKFLAGRPLDMPLKNDAFDFNPENSLLNGMSGSTPEDFIYRSVLTPYKEGWKSTIRKYHDKNTDISRMYIINYSLFSLFKMAYPEVLKYGAGRTFIEVKDSLLFRRTINNVLVKENVFCYEIVTPPVSQNEITVYLRNDLLRSFQAIALNEMRPVNCYAMMANNQIKNSFTKGGLQSIETNKESLRKYLKNTPVSELTALLSTVMGKPVINETEITQNIDIEFPENFYDFSQEEMISCLYQLGFTLTPAVRVMEVAVICPGNK